jgi:hypothetical protein
VATLDGAVNGSQAGYSALPSRPAGDDENGLSARKFDVPITKEDHVVGLGAMCDLDNATANERSQHFSVSEFASLGDGRRVILHRDRGFTIAWGRGVDGPPLSTTETVESVTRNVLNVVLPDEDNGDDHPWSWLAKLCRSHGLNVTADELKSLPYQVILTEGVSEWLQSE